MTSTMRVISIKDLKLDPQLQPRVKMNDDKVDDYAALLAEGVMLPPPVVFADGKKYLVADGFHRIEAHVRNELPNVQCEVKPGGKRDAILYSCGANATHGLPRTNEDKHRAVSSMVLDPEWSQWSDRAIAKHCGVGNTLVGTVRRMCNSKSRDDDGTEIPHKIPRTKGEQKGAGGDDLTVRGAQSESSDGVRKYKTRHGTEATMKTGGIKAAAKARSSGSGEAATEAEEGDTTQSSSGESSSVPKGWEGVFEVAEQMGDIKSDIGALRRRLQALAELPGGESLKESIQRIETDILNVQNAISFSIPVALCSYCNGTKQKTGGKPGEKCGTCKGRGWENRSTNKAAAKMEGKV